MKITCQSSTTLPLSELTDFQGGLKQRTEDDIKKIIASIDNFGFAAPFFVWKNEGINHVLDGHGRLAALNKMRVDGEKIPDIPVVYVNCKDMEEAKNLLLRINSTYGRMTKESVLEFMGDLHIAIDEIRLPDGALDFSTDSDAEKEKAIVSLKDRFIVPPMSILDTRQGYWQDRKRLWGKVLGDLTESRTGEFGQTWHGNSRIYDGMAMTSTFDPVLAETMYLWFCPPQGKIIDPFGGEQTKGVVAGVKGYAYQAVEIRKEQVEINTNKVKNFPDINYFCGDSNNITEIITDSDFDMCFTSPPYYDLEVYSKEDLSSLGSYDEFMAQYKNIFSQVYDKLKQDAFLVIKIGEIRNKKTGLYRGFVQDNIRIFNELGLSYYNELILVNNISSAAYRAGNSMKTRKVGKTHQNILVFKKDNHLKIGTVHENIAVFYKGDLKNIPKKHPPIQEALDDELFTLAEQED